LNVKGVKQNNITFVSKMACNTTKLANLYIVCLVCGIFGILFMFTGLIVHSSNGDVEHIYGFVETQCTLTAARVVSMPNCVPGGQYHIKTEYIAIWKREEDGSTVIEDPYAGKSTEDLASRDLDDYPLNVTQRCICNPNFVNTYPVIQGYVMCQLWKACVLDVDMIIDKQNNSGGYLTASYTLLILGGVVIILSIIVFIAVFFIIRRMDNRYIVI